MYAQVFHDSNLTSRCHARSRQWWLILFSLDDASPLRYVAKAGWCHARHA